MPVMLYIMEAKTKGILSIVFGVIGIIILPIIFGPLAIYFGIKAKKEGFKKLGNAGIIIGIIALILMFFSSLITKFIIFPLLGSMWNTSTPIAIMTSGSMSHDGNFDQWWSSQQELYSDLGISKDQFQKFSQSGGFDKGDILMIKGIDFDKLQVGDIILFESQRAPIPHRIVRKYEENGINYVETKGDHNVGSIPFEKKIKEDQIIGKISGVIPNLGWVKIWYIEMIS